MSRIHHIARAADWARAQTEGRYTCDSLAAEGFIHCCRADQLRDVAQRYFAHAADLVLLTIDTTRLTCELRDDPVRDTTYPHVYGPIDLDAVTEARSVTSDELILQLGLPPVTE